ncbi:hypothetical protein [Streptomyces javensis]|uniref:Uncharacterized protein n=1 Tax=Streptomyces javensis TaxID=114698 RepID=A0ABS0R2P0_9ACTN|nr:hypothetical protein [Streptomyces javensis]MBI0311644.1 hypothetical protein [Streptomyces javensis]
MTPFAPADAAWIRDHVLAPLEIPPAWPECSCQGISNACRYGTHGDCGHDQWVAWWGTEPETVIGGGFGPFPCRGSFGLNRSDATVYLADRKCHTRCNCHCHCHQPPPPPSPAPTHTEQLDLLQEEL